MARVFLSSVDELYAALKISFRDLTPSHRIYCALPKRVFVSLA